MKFRLILSLLVLLCIGKTSFSQNKFDPISDLKVYRKHLGEKAKIVKKTRKDLPIEDTDTMYVCYSFEVNDWANIKSFHVKLATPSKGDKRIVEIPIDNPNDNLPSKMKYWVSRNRVYITVGGFNDMKKFNAQIIAENQNGEKSKPLKVDKND